MKALVLFGLAYVAVPLSSILGIQTPVLSQPAEVVEEVQADPPLPVAEPAPEPEPPKSQKELNKEIVRLYTIQNFGEDQVEAMNKLVMKESGFNNKAQNKRSTAYGMFQFLDSTWKGTGISKTSDPIQQTEAGCIYIKNRYGTPQKALDFHLRSGWY